MAYDMMPAALAGEEITVYRVAAAAAGARYIRKNGGPGVTVDPGKYDAVTVREELTRHAASWHAEHDGAWHAAQHRAGMSAVRKIHRDRVAMRDQYRDNRIGTPDPGYLARLEETAAASLARLEILAGKPARKSAKPAARKLAAVPDVAPAVKLRKGSKLEPCTRHAGWFGGVTRRRAVETCFEGGPASLPGCAGPDDVCRLWPGTDYAAPEVCTGEYPLTWTTVPAAELERDATPATGHGITAADLAAAGIPGGRVELVTVPAPDNVPAPMPPMTRAARKQTRRELAATMRAAGIRPEGDAWREACRAAGLPVPELEGSDAR